MRSLVIKESCVKEFLEIAIYDSKTFSRLSKILEDTLKHPFEGIGKPEALKHDLAGFWSRRINDKDRLVYQVTNEAIIVISCKYHYSDK